MNELLTTILRLLLPPLLCLLLLYLLRLFRNRGAGKSECGTTINEFGGGVMALSTGGATTELENEKCWKQ